MSRTFPLAEIAKHKTESDLWIVIKGKVYDVTKFLSEHPGGKKVVLNEGGKDATKKFELFHKPHVLEQWGPKLFIGYVEGQEPKEKKATPATPAPKTTSPSPAPKMGPTVGRFSEFGDGVPYGDANWYQGFNTAYYNESHVKWRKLVRDFAEKELIPYALEWDEKSEMDKKVFAKAGKAGILPGVIGPPWPEKFVGPCPVENFDCFHELIIHEEVGRAGSGGILWALLAGLNIGLPPVMHFGSPALQEKCAKASLEGNNWICLAITEPEAGSDVASLTTTARREGDYYIVNGSKKWITNGVFANYFTTAVRTGGPGAGGISLLLIERSPGVTTRQMNCMGVKSSGTTFITFEDVKVPVKNLIGKENEGFKYIMYNFNHERWALCVQSIQLARVAYEEAFVYATKRKTFGARLVDHQVLRWKFGEMARQIESSHAWLENITYQMCTMDKLEQNQKLGGAIALLKVQATKTFEYCAREAAQVFGGASYVRGGVGEKVERLYREVRAYAIPGGSEEIMIDLGVRQAIKTYDQKHKSKL